MNDNGNDGVNGAPVTTPYDNDVTLLYKWSEFLQTPPDFIIVRPRTPENVDYPYGTDKYIFEPVNSMVARLYAANESPADVYDAVKAEKKTISLNDIIMSYYSIFQNETGSIEGGAEFINNIYYELDNTQPNRFESDVELYDYYDKVWYNNFLQSLNRSLKRLAVIEDIQRTLVEVDKQDKIPFSPVTLNSSMLAFNPTINGISVTVDDGPDVFNNSYVSKYVPFIRYNDKSGRSLTRVYTGSKTETGPNYAVTVVPYDKYNDRNTIYLTLWLAEDSNDEIDLYNAPAESFFIVIYNLENNTMTIKIPIGADPKKLLISDKRIAIDRTQNALPSIVLGPGSERKVGGDFDIWGFEYEESSLLDMILVDPLLNVYLYVEENIKPFAFKKRLDIHYRSIFVDEEEATSPTSESYISNFAAVSLIVTQRTAETDMIIEVADPDTNEITQAELEAGTPYVHINIKSGLSRDVVNAFIPIFRLLLRYYYDNKQELIDTYNDIFPDLNLLPEYLQRRKQKTVTTDDSILDLTKKTTVSKKMYTKMQKLKEFAPDVFVEGYAKICQSPLQPIIVTDEEAEEWKKNLVEGKPRKVLNFPHADPKWKFVCPSDAAPYPTLKINKDLPNQDEYPYLPCCAIRDKLIPGKKLYENYIANKRPKYTVGAKAEKKISTAKFLTPEGIGSLPRAVESIVRRYSEDSVDMSRFGMIYSKNSLLHCISVAVDDPRYMSLGTDDEKEDYVSRIRAYISTLVEPGLLKQELYDYTDEEIKELLDANSDNFLDPSLVYRAIEEVYDINIYVFAPGSQDEEFGIMDIPRFNIFHARPLRLNRPTVVIMKMSGPYFPQCELVVDYDKENLRITKLFGPEMTEICHAVLQTTFKTITWKPTYNNTFNINANLYYYIDHLNLFQVPPVSQFIDNNGKMRALSLDIGNNQLLTIATILSQPENLPVSNEISRVPLAVAIEIFGAPTGVTRDGSGTITGCWFSMMDIKHAEYVYVIPTNEQLDVEEGPKDPLIVTGENVTSRLIRLRKNLNVITQLVKWLYELYKLTHPADPNEFASRYMLMISSDIADKIDSSTYYDVTQIPRRLPLVTTVDEAISILQPVAPTLFSEGHIVMYSPAFAERIIKMLNDYHTLHMGLDTVPKQFIDNYYETENDLNQHPGSKVFISENELQAWLTSLKSSQDYVRYFNIRKKVDPNMAYSPDPYLYQDEDGKIFIIQNIIGGSKLRALAVAQNWQTYKVNIGFEPLETEQITPYMIYGISPSFTIVPIEDHTGNSDVFVRLLYYGGTGAYAAILELL